MPLGMTLRSNWSASNIAEPEPHGEFSLETTAPRPATSSARPCRSTASSRTACGSTAARRARPRHAARARGSIATAAGFVLELDDGERLSRAHGRGRGRDRAVPVAAARRSRSCPRTSSRTPASYSDMSRFRGRRLADRRRRPERARSRGAGAREAGAEVEIFSPPRRGDLAAGELAEEPARAGRPGRLRADRRGPALVQPARRDARHVPPPAAQGADADRVPLDPAGVLALQIRMRLDGVPLHLGRRVASPDTRRRAADWLDDGREREFDHVMFGTGYSSTSRATRSSRRRVVARLRRARRLPDPRARARVVRARPALHRRGRGVELRPDHAVHLRQLVRGPRGRARRSPAAGRRCAAGGARRASSPAGRSCSALTTARSGSCAASAAAASASGC